METGCIWLVFFEMILPTDPCIQSRKTRPNTTTPSKIQCQIFGIAEFIFSNLKIRSNRLITYHLYTLYLLNIYDIIVKNNIILMIF